MPRVEDHQLWLGREPLREHDLLLVAAREEPDLLAQRAEAKLDGLDERPDLELVLAPE